MTTREYVLAHMAAKFAEHGQRLFWLSKFDQRPDFEIREVVDELEAEGIVEWRLQTTCPDCNREWGGHPKNAPKRCRICGYNTIEEEGPEFFVADTFAWKRDPK